MPAGITVIGIGAVIVGLLDGYVAPCGKRCRRSRAAGVFPFRFSGKSVAVRFPVPSDGAGIAGSGYRVGGRQSLLEASGIAVRYGIMPTDVFHRQIVPLKLTGLSLHEFPVFLLGDFMRTQVKVPDGDLVLLFVFFTADFRIRTAHRKGSTFDEHQFIRRPNLCPRQRQSQTEDDGCECFHGMLLALLLPWDCDLFRTGCFSILCGTQDRVAPFSYQTGKSIGRPCA